MESLKRSVERRANAFGFGKAITVQILGDDRLVIQLFGVRDLERAKRAIGETGQVEFKHRRFNTSNPLTEITNDDVVSVTVGMIRPDGILVVDEVNAMPVIVVEFTEEGIVKFAEVADRIVQSLITAAIATQSGARPTQPNRLEVSVEGVQLLRFELLGNSLLRLGDSNRYAFPFPTGTHAGVIEDEETARSIVGDGATISFTEIGTVDEDFGLTGDDLSRAYTSQHAASGVPMVNLVFGDRGTRIFGDKTEEIAGLVDTDAIAIFLDGEEIVAPVVTAPIKMGTAIIQGDFTIDRARDIALLLESGRLPIPITLIQERDVAPAGNGATSAPGDIQLIYQAQVSTNAGEIVVPERDQMESLIRSIVGRVKASGFVVLGIDLLGDDRLLIVVAGVRDPGQIKVLIGATKLPGMGGLPVSLSLVQEYALR